MPVDPNSEEVLDLLRDIRDGIEELNTSAAGPGGPGSRSAGLSGSGPGGGPPGGGSPGGRRTKSGAPFGGAAGIAGSLLDSTVGFGVNAVLKGTTKAARQGFLEGATNAVRFEGLTNDAAIRGAGSSTFFGALPIIGNAATDITNPRQTAVQRVKGQFAGFLRAGGKIEGEARQISQQLTEFFRKQEASFIEGSKVIEADALTAADNRDESLIVLKSIDDGIKSLVDFVAGGVGNNVKAAIRIVKGILG